MAVVKIVALVMLVSLTFGAGLQVNVANLRAVFKEYGLLARALFANFILVPFYGWLAVWTFKLSVPIATGLLLMAIAPGVPFIVRTGARKQGGSLGFAVTLAAIMPALSVFTIPITASILLVAAEQASLPLHSFIVSLAFFQLLPLAIGIAISERAPAMAAKLERPMFYVFIVTLLAVLVILSPEIWHDITSVFGSRGMLASLCVVVLSIVTGYALGGPHRAYRRTLSIGTGLRNIGLCASIATVAFKGGLVAASVMAYLIVQAIVCGLAAAYFKNTAEPDHEPEAAGA